MKALLAAAAAATLLGGCYNRAAELAELSRHHATTAGRVAALDCANGGRWWYEFEAGGKRRRGVASDAAGCAQRRLGDTVTVYYNPRAPQARPYEYRDYGSLVSFGQSTSVGSLMGSLRGFSWFVEGFFARMMYVSLHLLHHQAVLGSVRTGVLALARFLVKRATPLVKLH